MHVMSDLETWYSTGPCIPSSADRHVHRSLSGVFHLWQLHACAQGVQPDVSIFNSMIAACAHGGEFAKARAMFDSMAEHGCQPDAVTFANLIRAYKKGGQWCVHALLGCLGGARRCGVIHLATQQCALAGPPGQLLVGPASWWTYCPMGKSMHTSNQHLNSG